MTLKSNFKLTDTIQQKITSGRFPNYPSTANSFGILEDQMLDPSWLHSFNHFWTIDWYIRASGIGKADKIGNCLRSCKILEPILLDLNIFDCMVLHYWLKVYWLKYKQG